MTRIYIFSFFLLALTCIGFGQQSGTLIVLNKSSHTVNFIDLDTDAIVAELQTGQNPHEVAVNPSGTLAVVTNYGTAQQRGNSLTVIDIPNRKVVRTIELTYTAPHGIEFFDSNRVMVTSETSQSLLLVDIESGKTDQVINTGQEISHMVTFAPKAKRAFVANIGSGSVSVIDMVDFTLEKITKTGQGAEGVAVSPDGNRLWITNRAGNTVTVLDVASLQLLKTIPSEKFPIRVKFTQKNHLALVSNAETGTVNIYDARDGKLLKTISMEATSVEKEPGRLFQDFENSPVPVGILIHPNDRFAYVANTNADVITVIDLETFTIIKRLKAGKEPDGLGFTSLTF
ncbi:MAG: YncE family protein [Flavobacteriaceae bacterium]|nr:YncE family protein [Flavobacteriaceae bacterium]